MPKIEKKTMALYESGFENIEPTYINPIYECEIKDLNATNPNPKNNIK